MLPILYHKKEGLSLDCASYPSVYDDDIQLYLFNF